jgi:hypothetical protein
MQISTGDGGNTQNRRLVVMGYDYKQVMIPLTYITEMYLYP